MFKDLSSISFSFLLVKTLVFVSTLLLGMSLLGAAFASTLSKVGKKLDLIMITGTSLAGLYMGVTGIKQSWKNSNSYRTKRDTRYKEGDKLVLIDELFYIVYDK